MISLPLLVLVCVTIWVAGWRKALEITAVSAFICLLFGLNFSGNVRELPRNLWVALRGIPYVAIYAMRHPGEWLYFLAPSSVLMLAWVAFMALRKLWSFPRKKEGHVADTGGS